MELVVELRIADAAIDGRLVTLGVEHRDGIGQTDVDRQAIHGVEIPIAIL